MTASESSSRQAKKIAAVSGEQNEVIVLKQAFPPLFPSAFSLLKATPVLEGRQNLEHLLSSFGF